MRKLLFATSFVCVSVLLLTSNILAQSTLNSKAYFHKSPVKLYGSEGLRTKHVNPISFPKAPLSALVSVPGATDIGVTGKWHDQTNGGPLHRIQVDPSDPNKVHAVIMSAFGVTVDDTTTENFFPMRRVYYVYSGDGGATWSTPKSVSATRSGYPSMILMERNGTYVPVIALHQFQSATITDVLCALYIEKAAPGTGDFQEITTSRITYNEEEKDIIWPAITLNKAGTKVLMIASISTQTTAGLDYMQFGTFTLNETKDNATWSGWKKGPAPDESSSITSGGEYAIHTAPSGKIGVVWANAQAEDLGLYYSESTDDGETWSAANNFYFSQATSQSATNDEGEEAPLNLTANGGIDFVFDGETPCVVLAAYYNAIFSNNTSTYIPSSGSLVFWREGQPAKLLVARSEYNTSDLLDPMFAADYLHTWLAGSAVDPEAVIAHPVFAQTSAAGKFSVYFETWVQDDTADVGEVPSSGTDPLKTALPFKSIYRIVTLDGGLTWQEPQPYKVNNPAEPQENRLDYRFPNASDWNPIVSGSAQIHTMFAVDSSAGLHGDTQNAGDPGWSEVSWFFQKNEFSRAKHTATPTFALEQNYPNPVVSGNRTIVPLSLANTEFVTLTVTDVMGREIATVFSGQLGAGSHELPVMTQSLAAGVYQYIVRTADATLSRAFTVTK